MTPQLKAPWVRQGPLFVRPYTHDCAGVVLRGRYGWQWRLTHREGTCIGAHGPRPTAELAASGCDKHAAEKGIFPCAPSHALPKFCALCAWLVCRCAR